MGFSDGADGGREPSFEPDLVRVRVRARAWGPKG